MLDFGAKGDPDTIWTGSRLGEQVLVKPQLGSRLLRGSARNKTGAHGRGFRDGVRRATEDATRSRGEWKQRIRECQWVTGHWAEEGVIRIDGLSENVYPWHFGSRKTSGQAIRCV